MKLRHRVIYGIVGGLVYASILAALDYFKDKAFDFKKFFVGVLIFGVFMALFASLNNNKKNES